MDFQKITIAPEDSIAHLHRVIRSTKTGILLFIFTRNVSFLSDTKALEKLKKSAENSEKTLLFIVKQKFVREIVTAQSIQCFARIPDEYKAGETLQLSTVLGEDAGEKVEENLIKKEPEDEDEPLRRPDFVIHRLNKSWWERFRARVFFGAFLLTMLSLGVVWWFSPQAVVLLKPKRAPLETIQNVLVVFPDSEILPEDEELPKIRGIFSETIVSDPEVIPTTGRRYQVSNASGKITLFNQTDQPKKLVPSRLQSENGLIFRFKKPLTIPPKQGTEPGKIEVVIEADEFDDKGIPVGHRGNLDAGEELIFPALRDELQEFYYGKTDRGPLVGGSTLTTYLVDDEEESKAQQAYLDIARDKGIQRLEAEVERRSKREKGAYMMLEKPDLLVTELQEFQFPAESIGTEAQTIAVQGKVRVAGVVFDQQAILDLLRKKVESSLDSRQMIIQLDPSSIEYQIIDSADFLEKKWLKLSVKIVAITQMDVRSNNPDAVRWYDAVKASVQGRTPAEARSVLINNPEIEQVLSIQLTPWWRQDLPADPAKIQFDLATD